MHGVESEAVSPRTDQGFEPFFARCEPSLRAALVSRFGPELGREAAAEALGYGWQHWDRVAAMDNPAGYLYRVGERWARRQRRPRPLPWGRPRPEPTPPDVEPRLDQALRRLSPRQRQAVVLTAGFGLTHAEVADLLGLSRSAVQNHVERGLGRLRVDLGVDVHPTEGAT